MIFCPKCGSVMTLERKGDKLLLKCTNPDCGYEKEPDERTLRALRFVAKPDKKAKVKTTSVIGEARKVKPSKEELEQAKEEFYELVLEQMGDYGE